MEKMFVHIAKKATFTEALKSKYTNSIVFIQDSQEIWTHGVFYAIPDTYKDKITNLETAVEALQAIYSFGSITDGVNSASATSTARTIKFTGKNAAKVKVGADGIEIDVREDTLATGATNGTVKFNDSEVAVAGLQSAAYQPTSAFGSASEMATAKSDIAQLRTDLTTTQGTVAANTQAAQAAQNTADAKIAAVSGASAIKAETDASKNVAVSLVLDNSGNVQLSQGANGLKAQVTIPDPTVTGIGASDKVLSLNGTLISSGLSLDYNAADKKIYLYGKDKTAANKISEIDCSDFIKDGMISNAELITEAESGVTGAPELPYLKITFNTDAGAEPIRFSVKSLVDIYDGQNVNLTSDYRPAVVETLTGGMSVQHAIAVLDSRVTTVQNAAGVSSFGGQTGAITVQGGLSGNGTVNLEMVGNDLRASIVGLNSAAFESKDVFATSAQGAKADSALQEVTTSQTNNYVTVTAGSKSNNKQDLAVNTVIKKVSEATAAAQGLADAYDVKSYVDSLFAWEEL